jgi:hypothetical protein
MIDDLRMATAEKVKMKACPIPCSPHLHALEHVDVTNTYSDDARRRFQFGHSYSATWGCGQFAKRRKGYDAVVGDV